MRHSSFARHSRHILHNHETQNDWRANNSNLKFSIVQHGENKCSMWSAHCPSPPATYYISVKEKLLLLGMGM